MVDITYAQVKTKLLSYPQAYLDFPFGVEPAVFRIQNRTATPKIFALLSKKQNLIHLSLKCDPVLAQTLRHKYESVMPGYHLNKKHWNTLILTGQIPWLEVMALIDHSHQLAS